MSAMLRCQKNDWGAAAWKVINPLIEAGKMPFLQSLVNRGVMGNLTNSRIIKLHYPINYVQKFYPYLITRK